MSETISKKGIIEVTLSRAEISSLIERHLRKNGQVPITMKFKFGDQTKTEHQQKESRPVVVRFKP